MKTRVFVWASLVAILLAGCSRATHVFYTDQRVWMNGEWHNLDTTVVLKQIPQIMYPRDAATTGKTGVVVCLVEVDTLGRAHNPDITLADDEIFLGPTLAAAQDLVFSIPTVNGRPVSMSIGFIASFEIVVDPSGRKTPQAHITVQTAKAWEELHVVLPAVTKKCEPDYPLAVRQQKIEGKVWVHIWINPEGRPLKISVLKSDNAALDPLARDAARRFEFTPAMRQGKPVWSSVSVPFKFTLQ
jgi:TonB family protein